jgi:hypothetical protein
MMGLATTYDIDVDRIRLRKFSLSWDPANLPPSLHRHNVNRVAAGLSIHTDPSPGRIERPRLVAGTPTRRIIDGLLGSTIVDPSLKHLRTGMR